MTRHWFSIGLQTQLGLINLNINDYFQLFSYSGFGKCFFSAFIAGFNPVLHIMIAVLHTGGYAVVQVKNQRDI